MLAGESNDIFEEAREGAAAAQSVSASVCILLIHTLQRVLQ